VDTSKREAWYARQIKEGVQVVTSHPKLVETGLDLLDFPTILFYESGYSLHTLRQASRRSWRIGQRRPVRVKFLCYEGTMQTACLRLIGYGGRTIGREELTLVPTPPATETHRPIPSPDGMKVFGVLDLETEMEGCRFSIGLRNSHDKSMRLAMTGGYRVFVCSNMAFAGDFTPGTM
jgi:hypothetical protein